MSVRNVGTSNTYLDFFETFFSATLVSFDEKGQRQLGSRVTVKLVDLGHEGEVGEVMRSGATQRYPFVLKVYRQGLYLLTFQTSVTKKEMSVANRLLRGAGLEEHVWEAQAYLTLS